MIKFCDCDYCVHATGMQNGHGICDAFPDGIPYSFDSDNAAEKEECNNGIHYEPRPSKFWHPVWNPKKLSE